MRRFLTVAAASAFAACSTYGEQDTTPPADAGAGTDAGADAGGTGSDAGITADGSAGRFCPQPATQNTQCWDFEDDTAPAGTFQRGSFALDSNVVTSGKRSLRATTEALAANSGQAWAKLSAITAGIPKKISIEARVYIDDPFQYGSILQISFGSGTQDYYEASVRAGGDGSLKVIEVTRAANVSKYFDERPLPAIGVKKWAHVSVELETFDFPGTAPTRKLVVKTDGTARLDDTVGAGLDTINPSSMATAAGITFIDSYSGAVVEQSVHIDDVLVKWTP